MTNKTKAEICGYIGDPMSVDNLYLTSGELSVLRWMTIQIYGSRVDAYLIDFWGRYD